MKKLQLFGFVALLAVGLAAAPAGAFTFPNGDNLGKYADYGSIFSPNGDGTATATALGTGAGAGANFVNGNWDQTIFNVTALYEPPNQTLANKYYSGGPPELLGLVYDLEIIGVSSVVNGAGHTIVTIQLGSAGRYTSVGYSDGRLDLWQNPDDIEFYDPVQDPDNWIYGTAGATPFGPGGTVGTNGYDSFPTINGPLDTTSTPVLSGTLVSPDGTATVLVLTLDLTDGTGASSQGYVLLVENDSGSAISTKYVNGYAYNISFQEDFTFSPFDSLNPGVGTTDTVWNTESEDPIRFSVIPEPATMSLLGMAMVGLGGLIRKRKAV